MLAPITTPLSRREFITYDLEWHPKNLTLRLAGTWDGNRYRYYRTMAEFLRNELTDRNRGKILFAHAGGNFDVQFVLEEIIRDPRYRVVATFSGSSAVIFKVRRGKSVWTFGDSFFLLREPLRKIGKWLGFEKLDSGAIFSDNWDELKLYNERDCRVLYMGLERLQETLLSFGGEMKATLASCAMTLFRRRYLHTTISTGFQLNAGMMPAYYASRVEVFQRECLEANYFDINSSFPHSMTFDQPGDLINYNRRIPDKESSLYIAEATVTVKPCDLPPLPYRDRHYRVLFPTGTWRSRFDVADIRLLLSSGHTLEKVHSVSHFAPFTDLAEYVCDLYERKRVAEGFEREVFKLLLNALYGKFGERPEKEKILIRPENTRCPHREYNPDCNCLTMISPDIWQKIEVVEVPHAHVPISCHITALSRLWLFNYLHACKTRYYCDTDSVICGPLDRFDTSDKLGDLKLEYTVKRGEFLSPKLYSTFRACPSDPSPVGVFGGPDLHKLIDSGWELQRDGSLAKVKSKGFRRMTYAAFCDLAEGKEYEFERMLSIKESIRLGARQRSGYAVRQLQLSKRARLRSPKRFLFDNGTTRPWTIAEIEARGDSTRPNDDEEEND